MQKLFKAFENIMVAVTFAEAGEYDEARKIAVPEHDNDTVALPVDSKLKTAGKA